MSGTELANCDAARRLVRPTDHRREPDRAVEIGVALPPAIARRAPRPGFDLGQRADRSAQCSRFRGRAGPGFFSDLALSFQRSDT
jgi:hypothetical protein